jgi:integrase
VKGGRLLLHDSKTGPRTVWLGDEARMLLASLERRGGSDPVFWNKLTRRPVGSIDVFWKGVKAEANLPGVRIHDLRHSFASHAAARSETLPMIGKLLGHARLQTTSRYAHLDDGPVLDAAERIGELIADAMGEDESLNHNTMCDTGALIHDR